MKIFNLSEQTALAVAHMVDDHDQPTTGRPRRLEIQAALRDILNAPTTAALRDARTIRKGCVQLGIYDMPPRQHEQPSYLFTPRRRVTRRAPRYHT